MSAGFVYILINPSFLDHVKIGRTSKTAEDRAAELSKFTGVPSPFIVVYDELVSDCEAVEKRLHERFAGYRVNPSREFFRVPMKDAIKALQQEAKNYNIQGEEKKRYVEVLPKLREVYGHDLKPDIHSAKIVHLDKVCFLEIVRKSHPESTDEIIERTDLGFIDDKFYSQMFTTDRSPHENAELLLHDLDDYDLMMCTSLFTDEACREIARRPRSSASAKGE